MNINRIAFVFAIILLVACGKKQNNAENTSTQQPAEYPTAIVHKQDTIIESEYPAVIRGQEDVEIKPQVDGLINAIYIDEGAKVKKGQRLFEINSPQTIQLRASAQQSVVSAQAQVNTAKLNVDRMKPLADKGIISNVQLQTYENSYQSALASLKEAEAQITNAQATYEWMTVTSPVDGVVGSIPYRKGNLVNSSNTLTTVANTENIYAYFTLNEKDLMTYLNRLSGNTENEKIQNIPEVTLILADGSTYSEKGKVETISGVIDTNTGTANFRARFPNKQGILKSGITGKVQIPQTLQNVIVIPQKATFNIQDKTLVYKVQGDSVVQKVINIIPVSGGQYYAVTNGLEEGERIAIDGVATLNNGQKIIIK